ncbi:MAG: GtrA family protein [Gemmatimonadaceae bacterium]
MPDLKDRNNKTGKKRKLEVSRFVRANLSAGVATWVEWLLVTVLVSVKLHYLVALAIGATVGAATDFTIKRNWAFIRNKTGMMKKEAIRYLIASAASLALNLGIAYVLVDGLGMMKIPGVITASIIVGVLWNYPVHRFFVFPTRTTAATT